MPHIVLDCPWCKAQEMTMAVHSKRVTRDHKGVVFAQCGRCTYPVVAIAERTEAFRYSGLNIWVSENTTDVILETGLRVAEIIPALRIGGS